MTDPTSTAKTSRPPPKFETWQVSGEIDTGAVNFPILKTVKVKYTARDWQAALTRAEVKLKARSNGLSPVTIFKVERVQPPLPKGA